MYVRPRSTARTTRSRRTRSSPRRINTSLDWNTGIDLPSLLAGQVEPRAERGDRERRRRRCVHDPHAVHRRRLRDAAQAPVYGLTISPTFYRALPGFRRRRALPALDHAGHHVQLRASRSAISDEFLPGQRASRRSARWLDCEQKIVSLSLSQSIEAKLKQAPDADPLQAKKVKVLSLNFDPLAVRLRARTVRRIAYAERIHVEHVGIQLPVRPHPRIRFPADVLAVPGRSR